MKKLQNITSQGVGESLKNLGKDVIVGTADAIRDITVGAFEQLFSMKDTSQTEKKPKQETIESIKKEVPTKSFEHVKQRKKVKETLFRWSEYREQVVVKRRIEELIKEIRAEAEALKKTTSSITAEIKEIERVSLENLPEKVGVYHVRFLEVILKLVRSLRIKASESKAWLEALLTRKKKRGSLFLALSKKKGTQYSLSEELKMARSVQ